jgi:hypothetical protein
MNRASPPSGHFHAVRFYQDAASLSQIVCDFVTDGLTLGEPAVLIATAAHAEHFRARLATQGIDGDQATAAGHLVVLDADTTLASFTHDGMPAGELFRNAIGPVLSGLSASHPGASIRAYGEMVDILWKKEQTTAAIKLEMFWNDLSRLHRFGLMCGYAIDNCYKESSMEDICGQHSHVVTDDGARVAFN